MAAKRVVFLSDAAWYGGAERYAVRLGAHLDRSRYAPALICPADPVLDGFVRDARAAGFDVARIPGGRSPGWRDAKELRAAIRSLSAEILHLNMPSSYDLSCGWAARIGRGSGIRAIVMTEHIVDLARSRRRALARRLSHRWIDRFIALSEANRAIMVARHGVPADRIRVILNGIEDPGAGPRRPDDAFTIACVGSLEERKGQGILVEALARLVAAGSRARLVLVGEGPFRSVLERRVRDSDLSDRVRFTGAVPRAVEEISSAHVLAVPSSREGIPFVVLEAMAAGAVTVVHDLPGIREVVEAGRTGLILETRTPEAWAAALDALDRDRVRMESFRAAAREEYERRFRIERTVAETCALYDEVLP